MSRDFITYLEDIKLACGKIQKYIEGMSQEDFWVDDRTVDAVIRNIEIIGEATKKVPTTIRNKYPSVK